MSGLLIITTSREMEVGGGYRMSGIRVFKGWEFFF